MIYGKTAVSIKHTTVFITERESERMKYGFPFRGLHMLAAELTGGFPGVPFEKFAEVQLVGDTNGI